MKMLTWNIAHRAEAWRYLLKTDADVALLQEASQPPPDVANKIEVDTEPWITGNTKSKRPWRTAIVKLTDQVEVNWLTPQLLDRADTNSFPVSNQGTLSIAEVVTATGESYTILSMYSLWERPHPSTKSQWIYADASAHRLISDLTALIGQQTNHRIIAAGDLNILHGYGEGGSEYWKARYSTVFERMSALGIPFVGPQSPNGRSAYPWPNELPKDSKNVPTYHTTRKSPGEAERQLDFVFASNNLVNKIKVTALNAPNNWGPSDHCQVVIEL